MRPDLDEKNRKPRPEAPPPPSPEDPAPGVGLTAVPPELLQYGEPPPSPAAGLRGPAAGPRFAFDLDAAQAATQAALPQGDGQAGAAPALGTPATTPTTAAPATTALPAYVPQLPAELEPARYEADRTEARDRRGLAALIAAVPAAAGLLFGPSSAGGNALLALGSGFAAGGREIDERAEEVYRQRMADYFDWMRDAQRVNYGTRVRQGELDEAERVRVRGREWDVADATAEAERQAADRAATRIAGMLDDVARGGDASAIAAVMTAGGMPAPEARAAADSLAREYRRRVDAEGVEAAQAWARIAVSRQSLSQGWARIALDREEFAHRQREDALDRTDAGDELQRQAFDDWRQLAALRPEESERRDPEGWRVYREAERAFYDTYGRVWANEGLPRTPAARTEATVRGLAGTIARLSAEGQDPEAYLDGLISRGLITDDDAERAVDLYLGR